MKKGLNVNLIIIGTPGSGKTTFVDRLKEKYKITYISIGEITRRIMNGKTQKRLREEILTMFQHSGDRDPKLIVRIIGKEIERNLQSGFIIDGIRNIEEINELSSFLGNRGIFKLDIGIVVYASKNELLKRIANRGKRSDIEDDSHYHYRINKFFEHQTSLIELLSQVTDNQIILDTTNMTEHEVFTNLEEELLLHQHKLLSEGIL